MKVGEQRREEGEKSIGRGRSGSCTFRTNDKRLMMIDGSRDGARQDANQ